MKKKPKKKVIHEFEFEAGEVLADKYEVIDQLGSGWEGQVYRLRELATGVERAGKLFFPHRNEKNKTAIFYAKKLHKLRHCPILIQYHTQETIRYERQDVTLLVSEYVEGELLSGFVARQPGQRLSFFEGLHLLYVLAAGMESVHHAREYHGDLHTDNVILRRRGVSFEVKLLDLYRWQMNRHVNIADDVVDLIRIFHESIGGARMYLRHPPVVKDICRGLKRSLILERFRTAGHLRDYLENLEWDY
jgi:tRNA A-37 threonylcarbamoyl transferase component Bud32